MNEPNAELMRRYGTADVYEQKLAGGESFAPLAARMMLGLLNVSSNQADEGRERALALQAQEMNRSLAQARAIMMMPAEQRMQHTRVPIALAASHHGPHMLSAEDIPLGYDEGMVRMASAIGRDLVYIDLEKDAGIGEALSGAMKNMGAGAKALKAGVGSLAQAKVKNVSQGISGALNKVKASPGNLNTRISQGIEQAGLKVRGALEAGGARAQAAGAATLGVKPPALPTTPRLPQPGGRVSTPQQSPGVQPPKGGQANIQQPMPATEPTTGGVQPPSPTPQPQPAAPGAPAPPPGPATAGKVGPPTQSALPESWQKAWKQSGLGNGGWKGTAVGLAAGGLAAYGAVQGAKGLAGMMGQESAPYQFNRGSAQPAAGINEYGYADRSTPFTQ